MAETSTTTNTVDKTDQLAMLAVHQHAFDHGLVVDRIEVPLPWAREDGIAIGVQRDHLDTWLQAVTVTGDPAVRRPNDPGLEDVEMVSYPCLLSTSIGDVRVTIYGARRVTPLRLVGAQA